MSQTAEYLTRAPGDQRDGLDFTPEASRRARGLPVYAAIRSLGREGLATLVDRCCENAVRMGHRLAGEPGVHILNDIVLNQVLVRFESSAGRTSHLTLAFRVCSNEPRFVRRGRGDGHSHRKTSAVCHGDDLGHSAVLGLADVAPCCWRWQRSCR